MSRLTRKSSWQCSKCGTANDNKNVLCSNITCFAEREENATEFTKNNNDITTPQTICTVEDKLQILYHRQKLLYYVRASRVAAETALALADENTSNELPIFKDKPAKKTRKVARAPVKDDEEEYDLTEMDDSDGNYQPNLQVDDAVAKKKKKTTTAIKKDKYGVGFSFHKTFYTDSTNTVTKVYHGEVVEILDEAEGIGNDKKDRRCLFPADEDVADYSINELRQLSSCTDKNCPISKVEESSINMGSTSSFLRAGNNEQPADDDSDDENYQPTQPNQRKKKKKASTTTSMSKKKTKNSHATTSTAPVSNGRQKSTGDEEMDRKGEAMLEEISDPSQSHYCSTCESYVTNVSIESTDDGLVKCCGVCSKELFTQFKQPTLNVLQFDASNSMMGDAITPPVITSSLQVSVHRLLKPEEVGNATTEAAALAHLKEVGIHQSDPDSQNTPLDHILNGNLETSYISLTSKIECAITFAKSTISRRQMKSNELFIATITLDMSPGEVGSTYFDVSGEGDLSKYHQHLLGIDTNPLALHYSTMMNEHLVARTIPPEEIVSVVQVSSLLDNEEDVVVDSKTEMIISLTHPKKVETDSLDHSLEAIGLTLEKEVELSDTINQVLARRLPKEVSKKLGLYSLPPRTKAVEWRSAQKGMAVYVCCGYTDARVYGEDILNIAFGTGTRSLTLKFPTDELRADCMPRIRELLNSLTKAQKATKDSVAQIFIAAIVSYQSVRNYQESNPLSGKEWWARVLEDIRALDPSCGESTAAGAKYVLCLCNHVDCDKYVHYKIGRALGSSAHLVHQDCILKDLNVRKNPECRADKIFDFPPLGVDGESINGPLCQSLFVTKKGETKSDPTLPSVSASTINTLRGTTIEAELTPNAIQLRRQHTDGNLRSYHKNKVAISERRSIQRRLLSDAKRSLLEAQYFASTGDASMDRGRVLERFSEVDQLVAGFFKRYGRFPFLMFFDAKWEAILGALGEIIEWIIKNLEEYAWTQRPGSVIKQASGVNFTYEMMGRFGSGKPLEIELAKTWSFGCGLFSRNMETEFISYSKEMYPALTLNQLLVGGNTDLLAARHGWPNHNRLTGLMLVDLYPALQAGRALLNPCERRFKKDVERLRSYHPARYFYNRP